MRFVTMNAKKIPCSFFARGCRHQNRCVGHRMTLKCLGEYRRYAGMKKIGVGVRLATSLELLWKRSRRKCRRHTRNKLHIYLIFLHKPFNCKRMLLIYELTHCHGFGVRRQFFSSSLLSAVHRIRNEKTHRLFYVNIVRNSIDRKCLH